MQKFTVVTRGVMSRLWMSTGSISVLPVEPTPMEAKTTVGNRALSISSPVADVRRTGVVFRPVV